MAIVIDLQLKGQGKVGGGITAIAKQLKSLQDQLDKLNSAQGGVASSAGKSASAINNTATAAQRATGVMSRLIKAQEDYNKALKSGNRVSITDAHDKLLKAQSAQARYQKRITPPVVQTPLQQAWQAMVGTSRAGLGAGGQMFHMPLLNRMQAVLKAGGNMSAIKNFMGSGAGSGGGAVGGALSGLSGIASVASTVVSAVGVAVVAIKLMADSASHAAEALRAVAMARLTTGASAGSIAGGKGLAGALGTDIGDIAGRSNSLYDKLGSNPYARQIGSQNGIAVSGSEFDRSATDTMGVYMKMVKAILTEKNNEKAEQMARILGMEDVANLRGLSDSQKQRLLTGNGGASKEAQQASAQYNAEKGQFSQNISDLITSIGTPIMKVIADLVGSFNELWKAMGLSNTGVRDGIGVFVTALTPLLDLLKALAWTVSTVAKAIEWLTDMLLNLMSNIPGGIGNSARQAINERKRDKLENSVSGDKADQQIKAIEDNTRALKDAREVINGGSRTRGAIPSHWRWQMMNEAMNSQAMRMGAF